MTIKIGKIVAIYLMVTGLGFLISSDYYSLMISHKGTDPVLINLSGMVHFFIGMTILVNHFLWKNIHQILVSLMGFMFLLKGVFLIALPQWTIQSGDNAVQIPSLLAIGFLLVGLLLGYMSFFGHKISSRKI